MSAAVYQRLTAFGLIDWLLPEDAQSTAEWVEKNVDLTDDTTSAWTGLVNLDETPHLIEPLNAWDAPDCRFITCMGPEQTNKSCTWQWGLLRRMATNPGPALLVWRNKDEAKDMFSDRMLPIMRRIPRLARALEKPGSCKKDRYHLEDMILYNCGAGSPVLSKPIRDAVGDEVDFWSQAGEANNSRVKGKTDAKNISNLQNIDKRTRTYPRTSKRALACSPTLRNGEISKQYELSSKGRWNVACAACAELTPSHWFSAFQFRRDDSGRVIPASITWRCRHCKHDHTEADKKLLNRRGVARYIHEHPERVDHLGFQWSAMAAHWITWTAICQAIANGGKNSDIQAQMLLDNSFKGVPLESRTIKEEERQKLDSRCRVVDPATIWTRFMTVDTQDLGFWWLVRGIDDDGNTHRLAHGYAATIEEIEELYSRQFHGELCRYLLIDRGGHRATEIDPLVRRLPNAYCYHGRGERAQKILAWSSEVPRCLLANSAIFQHRVLWHLYSNGNEAKNFMFMGDPSTMDDNYRHQILAVQPPKNNPKADISEWPAPAGGDHLFDCEKMWAMIWEEFKTTLQREHLEWRAAKEKQKESKDQRQAHSVPVGAAGAAGFITGGNTGWQL